MDVVLATHPGFPTTQPLGSPLDLREAARLTFDDPIHLDQVLNLWITRADAEPTNVVLKTTADETSHVLRERVAFVHRWPDDKGVWQTMLVVRKPGGAGYELVRTSARQDLGNAQEYLWDRAFSWNVEGNSSMVVPTKSGVSIIRPDRRPLELHHEFKVESRGELGEPQVLLDWRGIIAWIPWENGRAGSNGAIRFVGDHWIDLDSSVGWPKKLVHLVPLLDGSILRVATKEDETAEVSLATLDAAEVDERIITDLVDQLSDPDPDKRTAAFAELTRYGNGVWPLLERLAPDQPPEAKRRIEELLGAKVEPTLGGMTLQPGKVSVVGRSRAGAALLYAETGVSILPAENEEEPRILAPAWLLILPGRAVQLAPGGLIKDYVPGKTRFTILGEEIIVSDDVQGPRWWLANHFSRPLLKKNELEFKYLLGCDARGRWLFRRSAQDETPTLILDPTLPDPTPRLPVWDFPVPEGSVGWTTDGWPTIKRGGAWVLTDTGWRALDESKEKMLTDPKDIPPPAPPASTTQAATMPATTQASTMQAATEPSEPPILVERDGSRFFDGRETLRMVRPDGTVVVWPLPPEAVGRGDVWLVRAGDDRLFLFNAPGRVLRIKQTPDAAEPFKLVATFTRRIPSVEHPIRIWVDPAGRIIMLAEPDHLLVTFPTGRIPTNIAELMPAAELKEAEGE
jgi:hypothetical protein